MRLDKLLAHTGYGTRKDVKEILRKKRVSVDGKIMTKGNVQVYPKEQIIMVDEKKIHYEKYAYLLLHKPKGYVSATVDNRDKTVIDLVPNQYEHYDLAPVGRLDKDTEGLMLLTNDGMLNHILTSPKNEIYKTYYAEVDRRVTEEHINQFKAGIVLDDGYQTKPAELQIVKTDSVSEIKLSICEGKFHQVKRMFQAIGMEVVYLKRLTIGKLLLDEELLLGSIRSLNKDELAYVTSLKE